MIVINWLAVLLSAAVTTLLTYYWFIASSIADSWRQELKAVPIPKEAILKTVGIIFLTQCVVSFMISIVMGRGDYSGMADGLKYGCMVGFGFASMFAAVHHLISGRSKKSWLVETVYLLLTFSISGAIIGSMH